MQRAEHVSWEGSTFDFSKLAEFQKQCRDNKSKYATSYLNNLVPVYDAEKLDFHSKDVQADLYKTFFDFSGESN